MLYSKIAGSVPAITAKFFAVSYQVTIIADVCSVFWVKGGPVVYARAGDVVVVVATHGDVLIAEDSGGRRFPVHKSKVDGSG